MGSADRSTALASRRHRLPGGLAAVGNFVRSMHLACIPILYAGAVVQPGGSAAAAHRGPGGAGAAARRRRTGDADALAGDARRVSASFGTPATNGAPECLRADSRRCGPDHAPGATAGGAVGSANPRGR